MDIRILKYSFFSIAEFGLNRFNVGAGVGAGLKINENLGINARYTFGLTGIGKDGNVTDYFLSNSKNNNLQVGLDFNF